MTQFRPAGHLRPALLLLLATCAAGCGRDAAAPEPSARVTDVGVPLPPVPEPTGRADSLRATPPPADPSDRSAMVFDTVAPPRPEPPVVTPSVPAVPAPRLPTRPPVRPSARPPEPGLDAPSASCDVRPAEGYCFAYTGPAWTPAAAAANCARAPGATFRAEACPTSGRIATCTFRRPSEPDRELVYTTYAPADLDLARLACPGTFELTDPP